MHLAVSDPKPGWSLAFEPCAVQFAGRTLILAEYAVILPKFAAPLVQAGVFVEQREQKCAHVKEPPGIPPFILPKARSAARDERGAGCLGSA